MAAQRVALLDVDGLRPDVLAGAMREGSLPNLEKILGRGGDRSVEIDASTVAPSTTYPSQASIITGSHPSEHGISGNSYFQRRGHHQPGKQRPYYQSFDATPWSYYRDALSVFTDRLADKSLGMGVETLPETVNRLGLSTLAVNVIYGRGSDAIRTPGLLEVARFFAGGQIFGLPRGNWDSRMLDRLDSALRGREETPELLIAYFLGVDHESHISGPKIQAEYLRKYIDPQIGRLVELLKANRMFEDTLFVLVSDHGQIPAGGQSHALKFGYPFTGHIESLFSSIGLHVPSLGGDCANSKVILGLNGGMAHVYVRARFCDWRESPNFHRDAMPVADAFFEMNTRGKFLPQYQGVLDAILIRDPRSGPSWNQPYRVYVGGGESVSISNFLAARPDLDYLDAENRMRLASSTGSGDVVLLANGRNGFYFGYKEERGVHGGLYRDESRAVLQFALPTGTAADLSNLHDSCRRIVESRCRAEGQRLPSLTDLASVLRQAVYGLDQNREVRSTSLPALMVA